MLAFNSRTFGRPIAHNATAETPLSSDGVGECASVGEIQSGFSGSGDRSFVGDRAEQLFRIFQTGFERQWVLDRLESVSGLTIAAAETELHVLDLFAVYIAIRHHPAQIWKRHGAALYKEFLTRVLTWWGPEIRGSIVPLLEDRFAVYNRIVSEPVYATLDDMVSGIAILAAMVLPDNCVEYTGPEHHDADGLAHFASALRALMEDGNPLTVTAARRVFRRSYDAVSQLLSEIADNGAD